jgi:DNA-binding transcriptional LysR family regulator
MRNVSNMEVFVRTVRCGSLSAAARALAMTPAAVSYRLSRLEGTLGTRLLHRTTRRLTLTEDGTHYLREAERLVDQLGQVEASVSRRDEVPQGTLKIAMPASFGRQHIAPLMPKFLKHYPGVRLNMLLSDDMIDIVGQGVDMAVRICRLKDSEFIARKLAPDRRVVCASPDYINRYGIPKAPEELSSHNCLVLSQQPYWLFNGPQGEQRIRVGGNFECNSGEAIREAAISGLGIALKATWDIARAIKTGRLVVLLKDFPIASETSVWAIYPSRRNVPAKVTAFISFMKEHFDSQPYWDELL